jgi:RHS repeat-associated protein
MLGMACNAKARAIRVAIFVAFFVAFVLGGGLAHAQPTSYHDEYLKRLKAWQSVRPYGDTPFGEQINLYTGEVAFRQEDIVLEGTGPVIRIARSRSATGTDPGAVDASPAAAFADWTIDTPRIETLLAAPRHATAAPGDNWRLAVAINDDTRARCTHFAEPYLGQGGIPQEDWWHGYELVLDDGSRQPVLKRDPAWTAKPGIPGAYPAVTTSHVQFACLPSTKNGEAGEGFLAIAPDGTRYWLDWLVGSQYGPVNQYDHESRVMQVQKRMQAAMFVTRVEDRFGNSVVYTYDGQRLTHIQGSDGRAVALAWSGNTISSITTHPGSKAPRTWRYEYANGKLSAVVQPDASRWTFDLHATGGNGGLQTGVNSSCSFRHDANPMPTGSITSRVTAPSGLTGTFVVQPRWHARSHVASYCVTSGDPHWEFVPPMYSTLSLVQRTLTGPGVDAAWEYRHGPATGSTVQDACAAANTCVDTKWIDVVEPGGDRTRYTSSTRWGALEGKLVKAETFDAQGTLLRTDTTTHTAPGEGTFVARLGDALQGPAVNAAKLETLVPVRERVITQQGTQFRWRVRDACNGPCFDAFARPLQVERAGTATRTDLTTYEDNTALWVLGQPRTQSTVDPDRGATIVVSQTDYDPATALPLRHYDHGLLQQTLTYHPDGNVATVSDGRDNPGFDTTMRLSGWMRGIPGSIQFPDGTRKIAEIEVDGTIAWIIDESGARTCYAYDAMGRITRITYPSETQGGACSSADWNETHASFEQSPAASYFLGAQHWRQTVRTGTGNKVTWFDAWWRPVLTQEYDTADLAGTRRSTLTRYDPRGRTTFASYPSAMEVPPEQGTTTRHDALGRVVRTEQASELGTLATTIEHLPGFQTRTTNPRGVSSMVTRHRAWDVPDTGLPEAITHAEGAYTEIERNVFGKPIRLTRRNADGSVAASRRYAYDGAYRLCKTIEPETGATIQAHDTLGNITWSAAGTTLEDPADCQHSAGWKSGRRVVRTYDTRNRLATITFPDNRGNQSWTYTPDGLTRLVTTNNAPGTDQAFNSYAYNARRLMVEDSITQPGFTWHLRTAYDRNGHANTLTYPNTTAVGLVPNALGQPTRVGNYATGVRYHPNGALKQFTYGNGLVHASVQNLRGLPERSRDTHGATVVFDESYDYDANGNVAAISDGLPGARGDRTMAYDALDRLARVDSPMFGTATYAYDVLDNLTRTQIGGTHARTHHLCYDQRWRLTNVKTLGCASGPSIAGLEYDAQGNLSKKNAQAYVFDHGNRLRDAVGLETYRYDAHGRRVLATSTKGLGHIHSQYDVAGRLMWQQDGRDGLGKAHLHLGGRLVAIREQPLAGGAATVRYQHTDALGTPVAETDPNRVVLRRSEYEPYGKLLNRPERDGVGYTGHVTDSQTGLVYMQQRYYDEDLGRFLSVDPVSANGDTGGNFNRYAYANNNPYLFVDPDGRLPILVPVAAGAVRCAANAGCRTAVSGAARQGIRWVKGIAVAAGLTAAAGTLQTNESQTSADDSASGDTGQAKEPIPGAADLADDLAGQELIGEIESGGGKNINEKMSDPKFQADGTHDKVAKSRQHPDGTRTELHAEQNRETGKVDAAKIKQDHEKARGN